MLCTLDSCDTELNEENLTMIILDSHVECYSGVYCSNQHAIEDLIKNTNYKPPLL
jgi:hypothetical protein